MESQPTVLIVEDSLTQLALLRHMLESGGCRVSTARDGREGFELARRSPPDLVITDVVMPEMDGYALCEALKKDGLLRRIPVILLTTLGETEDIVRGLQSEADYYLTKPVERDYLLACVRGLLAQALVREDADRVEVTVNGTRHVITTGRRQILNLLISTYESAVRQNRKLIEAQAELQRQQEQLARFAEELQRRNAQMEEDLKMARELQQALLPEKRFSMNPSGNGAPNLDFVYHYRPATIVGGDFFHVLRVSDSAAGVLVADVMGHGVRPALVTTIIRGLAQELREAAHDPGEFLCRLNQGLAGILREAHLPIFASAWYLVADAQAGELRFANAGHPAPLHVRRTLRSAEPLRMEPGKSGAVLGLFEGARYGTSSVPLHPRDVVLLFTDGLFEVEGAGGALLDEERLNAIVQSRIDLALPDLVHALIEEVERFSATGDFQDDVCIVGMEAVAISSHDR